MARVRIGRWWLFSASVALALIQAALVLLWLKLPEWAPLWTAKHAPIPEMALRAMKYDQSETCETLFHLTLRDLTWGSAIGPALRQRFAVSDLKGRLLIVALGTHTAGELANVTPGEASAQWQGQVFSAADIHALREDLYELARSAVADGGRYLPSNAAYLTAKLHEVRMVPPLCAALHGQKTPIDEAFEPVVRTLGLLADARAVPALIPLLPIRHKAHPDVEEALARCLADSSDADVIEATRHPHEVVRTWAARQFSRYRTSPAFSERIIALIADPERQVSVAAIRAIVETKLTAAGDPLRRLAQQTEDTEVKRAADEALVALSLAGTP